MSCFIIIPAYNEQESIGRVIAGAKEYSEKIIVVDDGSKDNTHENAKHSGVVVLKHTVNLGKGAALKTGCEYAFQNGASKVIVMDADTQHDPKEIPKFLEALKDHDLAIGIRKVPDSMPLVLKFGNKFINQTLGLLHGIKVPDSQCGYRGFTINAYHQIKWDAADYYVETEMLIKAGKKNLKYTTIPIETIYSDKYKGTTVLDGVKIVMKMAVSKIA